MRNTRWVSSRAGTWVAAAVSAVTFAGVLAACGGGGGGDSGTGTLRLALTDAPSCGYDAVNVTVERIRVHRSATADVGDGGWSELVLNPARRIDLTQLTNGVLEELGETRLPAGRYTQMRLVLARNGGADPMANAVTPTGGAETALDTPSAQQSGLKLNVNIDVPADQVADVVLDFEACKSVVRRGNSGRYNLKPVIAVLPRLSDAGMRVVGYVDPALLASGPNVSVQQGGVTVKATQPATDGRFVLYPVPEGIYELVVSAPDRATAVITGVPVVTTAVTTVNTSAPGSALLPPASAASAVSGTVLPDTATVHALQKAGDTVTVEAAWLPVVTADTAGDPGTFAAALPTAAPVVASYAPAASAVVLQPYAPAAGRYTLRAISGDASKDLPIDLSGPLGALGFVFP